MTLDRHACGASHRSCATDGGYHLDLYLSTSELGDTLMEARTMSLPPAASQDDGEPCLRAIELSKKSRIVAVNTPCRTRLVATR
jgi:hypothetical protein